MAVIYNGMRVRVTVSAGLHLLPDSSTAEAALKAADGALYVAERAGQNRVAFSLADASAPVPFN